MSERPGPAGPQPPRIWWSPSRAAEAAPGSLMAGLMWQHVSGQGYVKPVDLPDDTVELVPVPAVGDVTPSLIGPMSRRIGQLGHAFRQLADNTIVADPVSPVDVETVEKAARAILALPWMRDDNRWIVSLDPPHSDRLLMLLDELRPTCASVAARAMPIGGGTMMRVTDPMGTVPVVPVTDMWTMTDPVEFLRQRLTARETVNVIARGWGWPG